MPSRTPKKRFGQTKTKSFENRSLRAVDNSTEYQSQRWRRTSQRHRQTHRFCVECEKVGRAEYAMVTDHIIPVSQGGSFYDPENHQGLCHSCHNRKSGGEAHYNKNNIEE